MAESLKSEQAKAEKLGLRDLAAILRRDHKDKMHQIDTQGGNKEASEQQ